MSTPAPVHQDQNLFLGSEANLFFPKKKTGPAVAGLPKHLALVMGE